MEKTVIDELFNELFSRIFCKSTNECEYTSNSVFERPINAKHYFDDETKEHVLTIQSAGFKKEDINIDVNNKGIEIKGEIKDENLKKRLCTNKFHYILHKEDIDPESVNASLIDGLLMITLKINSEKNTKTVEIK